MKLISQNKSSTNLFYSVILRVMEFWVIFIIFFYVKNPCCSSNDNNSNAVNVSKVNDSEEEKNTE